MSTQRMKELRQRRTRKKKIALLRKHYENAQSDAERAKIVEKLQHIFTISREQFLSPLGTRNKHSARGDSAAKG